MEESQDNKQLIPTEGFRASQHYENVRPSYPREGVELLVDKLGLIGEKRDKTKQLTVLELGAGTGKFTRVMAELLRDANVRIIASDPVKEMCEQFKRMQPGIEIRQFGAEDIDLPDGSVDVVIAATSFHWFCYKENAIPEIHRVLCPNGMLGVSWLFPDKDSQPFLNEILEYLLPYSKGIQTDFIYKEEEIISQLPMSKKFSKPECKVFLSYTKCNLTQFYQLTRSFGAVQVMPDKDLNAFTSFFTKVMEEFAVETGEEISSLTNRFSLHWCKKI